MLALVLGYLSINVKGENYTNGIGIWVALVAAAVIFAGGAYALLRSEVSDEPDTTGKPRVIITMVVLGLFLGFAGGVGSWILDQRSDAAQIARELAEAAEGQAEQGGLAAELLAEAMAGTRREAILGLQEDGPQIGYIIIAITVIATVAGLARLVTNPRRQHLLGWLMFGTGLGILAISSAWIASLVRLAENQISPGASSFLAACGALVLAALGWQATKVD